jgi:serine/threonine-protein kinase
MKTCPHCTTGYHDSQNTCPVHGLLLNEIRDLKPGLVIHKTYRIVRKLGQGGMGAVYLAENIQMDLEPRALKFLASHLSGDEAFTSRLRREVRTLRQVHSVHVIECGDLEAAEDDSLFFSMEFVDGPDLRDFLDKVPRPLDVPLVLSMARGMAEGLGAAHARGIVHRDIKPENILLAHDANRLVPKIADFGIVATKENGTAYTRTGGTLLTMAYAAPEQWEGMRAIELDGRTDLYALGGVLFEMLTGQTVFQAESYEGWAKEHKQSPPQPPSELRPDLANWRGLDQLVLRLLAKRREDRPADVAEFLVMLNAIEKGEPVRRETPPEPPVVVLPSPPPAAKSLPRPAEVPPASRSHAPEFLGVVFVVLAGIAFFYYMHNNQSQPSLPAPAEATTQPQPQPQAQIAKPSTPAKPDIAGIARQANALYDDKQYSEARPLLEQACGGGNAQSCDNLGELYEPSQDAQGATIDKGVKWSWSTAAEYHRKACDAGNARGCYSIGALIAAGYGVTEDDARAAGYFTKGCDLGNELACNELADWYADGQHSLDKDAAKAKVLFQRACDLNQPFSKYGCDKAKEIQ